LNKKRERERERERERDDDDDDDDVRLCLCDTVMRISRSSLLIQVNVRTHHRVKSEK